QTEGWRGHFDACVPAAATPACGRLGAASRAAKDRETSTDVGPVKEGQSRDCRHRPEFSQKEVRAMGRGFLLLPLAVEGPARPRRGARREMLHLPIVARRADPSSKNSTLFRQ